MEKSIIFCADGTWNGPNRDEDRDGSPENTNVYKLFLALAGDNPDGSFRSAVEQEKVFRSGDVVQVAKYIHGVGDSRNSAKRLIEGATGTGTLSRIVRGYTFISRNYEPGASIHIVGFSRGAYTARALAGLIVSQGLLGPRVTGDKELAYCCGTEAWRRHRAASTTRLNIFVRAAEMFSSRREFFERGMLQDADLLPVERIASVAVWDTVGSLGLPDYHKDARRDEFKFANTVLASKVARGFHAISLDECRADFTPTLWDAAGNVTQMLFPGGHSDVGGGYPDCDGECGLSNGALKWIVEQLGDSGVRFADGAVAGIVADSRGTAHKPWKLEPWLFLPQRCRVFPAGIAEHPSIAERMAAGSVVAQPGEAPGAYLPGNRV